MRTKTPDRVIVEIKLRAVDGSPIGKGRIEKRGNVWCWFHPWGSSGEADTLSQAINALNKI